MLRKIAMAIALVMLLQSVPMGPERASAASGNDYEIPVGAEGFKDDESFYNNGESGFHYVGIGNIGQVITALQFDLSGITESMITEATLAIEVNRVLENAGDVMYIDLKVASDDTWAVGTPNRLPNGDPWTTIYREEADLPSEGSGPVTFTFDNKSAITSYVQSQLDGDKLITFVLEGNESKTIPNGVTELRFNVDTAKLIVKTAVNTVPEAQAGTLSVTEDMEQAGTLSGSDLDGDALTYSIVSQGSKGTAAITNAATGAYTYTPNPNATGSDSFTFRVNDGTVNSASATVTVTIAAVNDAPVAQAGTLVVAEDSFRVGALSSSDPDGDALTYSVVTQGSKGSMSIANAATGAYIYTPNVNATGSDSFTFKVNDGTVDSPPATVTVTIAAVNDAPAAQAGTLAVTEDTPRTGTLTGSDVDGDALTYSVVTQGSKGSVTITNATTGAYTYTPNTNATGSDSFTFRVNDGTVNSTAATVTVTITDVNDAPVAQAGTLAVTEDTPMTGTLSASDPDDDALTYSIVSQGSKGNVTITNATTGAYTYTPNAIATGSDSFTFRVNDGTVSSAPATVTVTIAAVNDAPVAQAGTLAVTEDTPRTGTLTGSDLEGDALTYSVVTQGSKGSVAITNAATGAYTYTPNANATGSDSFTFRVNDGTVNSAPATVTVTIAAVNDAPTAQAGTLSVQENTPKTGTLTGSDVDGDALTYSIVSQGTKGSVAITNAATGAYTYTPNANATGSDSFTFRVNDGTVNSAAATVTVTITDVNGAPVAQAGTLAVTEDTQRTGTLSASDPDDDALTYSLVSQGSKGTVAITNTATGAYTYAPDANATGSDSFTFKVNDGTVDSLPATVTVTIAAVNDAPTAQAGTLAATEDTQRTGTLTGSDVDGDALTYSVVTQGSKGSVAITNAATGAYTYTPNANATGSDSFTFRVNDGTVNSAPATVTVTIAAVNDAPTAQAGTLSVQENTPKTGTLTGSDVDGDALTYSVVTQGSKGSVAITNAATGAYTYTPNANATGSDSFTFRVNDGTVNSTAATVTVTITDVNAEPVAQAGTLSVTEDAVTPGTLIGTDSDGDTLTYSIVSQGSKGSVTITNATTGAYTYTPNANATGSDSFTFRVNDGTVNSAPATVTVTIAAVNDAPTAQAGTLAATEDTQRTGTLTGSDVDGDALTYSVVTQGSKGSVAITNAATGAYTYTPNANATGSDSFTFRVNDGTVNSAPATVTVTIAAVNDAPTAQAGALSVQENTPKTGTLTGSDVDGDALTYSIVSEGSKGSVVITNAATGVYTYTPNANATGSDSFTFQVNDGTVNSAAATVTVTITDVNVAPVAQAGTLSVTEDTVTPGTLTGTDLDGDPLTYSIISQGSKGSVTITDAATGAYNYSPNTNVTGSDSFTFKVNDGTVDAPLAIVTVTIAAVNDAPEATAGTLSVTEDTVTQETLAGTDADGDSLTYSIVSQGSKGNVTITDAATGAYTYTPNTNATGSDTFTFKVNDGTVDSPLAIVTVTIAAVNDVPTAQAGTLSVQENTPKTGTLTGSDVDGDALTYSVVTQGSKGSVAITNAATGAYTYTPNTNATGNDSFTFEASDGNGGSAAAVVNVQIRSNSPVPSPVIPVVQQDVTIRLNNEVILPFGTTSINRVNGQSELNIHLDNDRLLQLIKDRLNVVLQISIQGNYDSTVTQLSGELIQKLANSSSSIDIQTPSGSLVLPVASLDTQKPIQSFKPNMNQEELQFSIKIAKSPGTEQQNEQWAAETDTELIGQPLLFDIGASYGEQQISLSGFKRYVEFSIPIPAGTDPNRVTTGVMIGNDGSVHHMPTKIIKKGDMHDAVISSMSNGTFALIDADRSFTDVAGHWSREEVEQMASRLIIQGFSDDVFLPDQAITRAQFATIVTKAFGLHREAEGQFPRFEDAAGNAWYGDAIRIAASYGLIKGYGDGKFRPNQTITRLEAMAILSRAMTLLELKGIVQPADAEAELARFRDADQVDSWGRQSAAVAVTAGIVRGDNGLLRPDSFVTRAETAAMVRRLLQQAGLI